MLTVVTPATNRKLTTVENLKAELVVIGSSEDARLGSLIERASGMIAAYCRRSFARQTYAETVWSPAAGEVLLSAAPIETAGMVVTENGTALVAADVEVDAAAAIIRRLSASRPASWRGGSAGLLVAYTAGYVLPGEPDLAGAARLPADVEQACILTATALYRGGPRDPFLRSESAEGVGSTSWIATADMAALAPQAVALLEPHRMTLA